MIRGLSFRIWLTAATSLISHPVFAQQWVEYTQTSEFRAFVDIDSIKPDGELVRAWEKLEYTLSQRDSQGKHYRTTLGDWAINCQQRTSALTALGYKTGDEAVWFNRLPRPAVGIFCLSNRLSRRPVHRNGLRQAILPSIGRSRSAAINRSIPERSTHHAAQLIMNHFQKTGIRLLYRSATNKNKI